MKQILAEILRKAETYRNLGMKQPVWLTRQIEAVHEFDLNKLVEGLQDELDFLNKVMV
jgi:hypothetical protein